MLNVQPHFFDRLECVEVCLPLGYRRVARRGCAVRPKQRLDHAIFFFRLLQPVQAQRTSVVIPRIKILYAGHILGFNRLGQRSERCDDVFAGIKKSPALPVEMIDRHRAAEIKSNWR